MVTRVKAIGFIARVRRYTVDYAWDWTSHSGQTQADNDVKVYVTLRIGVSDGQHYADVRFIED